MLTFVRGMSVVWVGGLLFGTGVLVACASEESSGDPRGGSTSSSSSGSSSGSATPDPTGGRDDKPASCFAACQNSSFNCEAKGASTVLKADLVLEGPGCHGLLKNADGSSVELKLDCNGGQISQVCVNSACGAALFSAFSFSYTPAGGASTVCTRE